MWNQEEQYKTAWQEYRAEGRPEETIRNALFALSQFDVSFYKHFSEAEVMLFVKLKLVKLNEQSLSFIQLGQITSRQFFFFKALSCLLGKVCAENRLKESFGQ